MQVEFNKIAQQYKKGATDNILRHYSFIPTFLRLFKKIKGSKVLVLACGEGFYSRFLKQQGAAKVLGVDVSSKMIALARQEEKTKPLGIKFFVCDVKNLSKIRQFDLVITTHLLDFAKTGKGLTAICKNIYKNLKKGGKFVAINNNPLIPLKFDKKYDLSVKAKKPLKEGNILMISLYKNGSEVCSFKNYFWKKETYNKALRQAGFKVIKWYKPIVSKEGFKKFGRDFWKQYLSKPPFMAIKCVK